MNGKKKTAYFEGWYYKLQTDTKTFAFIPAVHFEENGSSYASLQMISREGSAYVSFPVAEFHRRESKNREKFGVRIGNSLFTNRGISLSFEDEKKGIQMIGRVKFGSLHPLRYDIMGPFCALPFMECRHGVTSMYHELSGTLLINGRKVCLDGGSGYIESDRGCSFPSSYTWTQCHWKAEEAYHSVMVSAARIPLYGMKFNGCIAAVCLGGKEYRLATYLGARIVTWTKKELLISQGSYTLLIQLLEEAPFSLKAPKCGTMSRTIQESPACTVHYCFMKNRKVVFDTIRENAGYEHAGENK